MTHFRYPQVLKKQKTKKVEGKQKKRKKRKKFIGKKKLGIKYLTGK